MTDSPLPAHKSPSRAPKIIIWMAVLVVIGVAAFLYFGRTKTAKVTYTTGTVTKGTLVVSVSASGTMNSDNRVAVSADVTGTISKIYVKNGDTVRAGQTIMSLALDATSNLTSEKARSNVLSANSNVTSAQQELTTANSSVTTSKTAAATAKQEYADAVSADAPSTVISQKLAAYNAAKAQLTASQNKATLATQNVTKAKLDQATSTLAYNQTLGTITAPVAGTINDITLVVGNILSSSSSSSAAGASGGGSGTQVATIITSALPTATVSLAETDVPKVKEGQKATLTFDAITDKTFTGTLVGVNRSGSVSSGVTTYPATIQLDVADSAILPNMSVTADIITATKDNVLLVPTAAVKTRSGTSTVQVMSNGQPQSTTVETGDSSDSQTVIISGLTEGQTVVTATITASTNTNTSSSSLFSGQLRSGTSSSATRALTTGTAGGPPAGF